MTAVTIYTRILCPYCVRAVGLLKKKNIDYKEIDAGFDIARKNEMIERAGGARTFPQVFIGETHVGGCDELLALERSGKLDPILQAAGAA
ncbi:MAG: glutaredoxin 3 [Pseudomonadota bacterium]